MVCYVKQQIKKKEGIPVTINIKTPMGKKIPLDVKGDEFNTHG
jgi:hypothetical protein